MQNREEAKNWFRAAAGQGYDIAKKALKELEGKKVSDP
jgi:CRISPR/Cas system CMR-associated protein Cmr1 (group 7 of RAMP superfamily)